jgi:hypothetical protein
VVIVALAALYFTLWLGAIAFPKGLMLAEYRIQFQEFSLTLLGALVLVKVVPVFEHVPLGNWVRTPPNGSGFGVFSGLPTR